MSVEEKRMCIDRDHPQLSVRRQCELLGLNRSSLYYDPVPIPEEDFRIMRKIDQIYTRMPYYGIRKMTKALKELGFFAGKKRVGRIMRDMGIQAIYPKRSTSKPDKGHLIYPYLLRGLEIKGPDHVWCTDITYIPLRRCFIYLVAIMDWYSRFVLCWEVSIAQEVDFCLRALNGALKRGIPVIFNSDQGSQFTSNAFTGKLLDCGIRISMDGRGRVYDNIFIERLWRSVKYEEVYLNDYRTVTEAREGLSRYFYQYNYERLHQSLGYRPPASVYYERREVSVVA